MQQRYENAGIPRWRVCVLASVFSLSACGGADPAVVIAQAGEIERRATDDTGYTIYDDQLRNGFNDWSWTSVDTLSSELRYTGDHAVAVTFDPWGGLYLVSSDAYVLPADAQLQFWAYSNDAGPVTVAVFEPGSGEPANSGVTIDLPVGTWTQISIPLQDLGSPAAVDGIWWQEAAGSYRQRIYLDDIRITATSAAGVAVGDTAPAAGGADEADASDITATGTDAATDLATDSAAVANEEPNQEPDDAPLDVVTAATGPEPQPEAALVFYDDAIAPDFSDWSWTTVDVAAAELVRSGDYAIAVDYDAWGGLYIGSSSTSALPLSGALQFSVFSNDAGPLSVVLVGGSGAGGAPVLITPTPGQWQDVVISLEQLGSNSATRGVWIQEAQGQARERLFIDEIVVTSDGAESVVESGITIAVSSGPETLVRQVTNPASGEVREHRVDFPRLISNDIYGINFAPNTLREELALPVSRWGGNATERYNFQTSSSNQGNDWFFANNAMEPDAHHQFESANQADGTASILTLPALGWVSADRSGSCSYPLANAGEQDYSIEHWLAPNTRCGNGYRDGEFLGIADAGLTSVPADERFAAAWVMEMVNQHGTAAAGGVEMYAIGNEPGLWHCTHGDVRQNPLTRDEFIELNIRYARAIKSADATAEVLGPVLWGGSSYYVAADELLSGVRPGDVPVFLQSYLQSMREAGSADGQRLLDRLAINFYDDRVYGGGSDSLRLESTRQLWDPDYAPADWWVVRDFLNGEGSALIPRMQSLIAETYPGTPLALTEYNFGGVDDVAGALAQVDALGIFGREGLDMATLWEPYADYVTTPEDEFSDRPVFWAFRLYRNYDGAGGRFGNKALLTRSSSEADVAAYAAARKDGKTTLMLINKTVRAQEIAIEGVTGDADVYRYSSADVAAITQLEAVELNAATGLTLPARSATLLVIEP